MSNEKSKKQRRFRSIYNESDHDVSFIILVIPLPRFEFPITKWYDFFTLQVFNNELLKYSLSNLRRNQKSSRVMHNPWDAKHFEEVGLQSGQGV